MDALKSLKAQGTALGICTNKPFDAAQADLDSLGIADFFDAMVGGDTLPVRKPDPAPLHRCLELLSAKAALYVGDSETDYDMWAIATPITTRRKTRHLISRCSRLDTARKLSYFKAATRFDDFAKLPGIVSAWAEHTI